MSLNIIYSPQLKRLHELLLIMYSYCHLKRLVFLMIPFFHVLIYRNRHPSRTSHIMISVSTQLFVVLFSLLLVLPVVEAVEAGDAIALLLGVILSITGICACLGVYARKRNGQM